MSAGTMQAAAADQASKGALGIFSALDVATKITTVLSLAALALLIAFLLARQWLANQRRTINAAIETGNADVLKTMLGQSGVDPGKVGKAEAGEILLTDVRQRFWLKLIQYGFALIGFLALLGFVLMLLAPKKAEAKPIDPLTMAGLLKFVPPDQRIALCLKTLDQPTCEAIVGILGSAYSPPQSETVKEAVDDSLNQGTASPELANAAKATLSPQLKALVIVGNPKGWDIDFNFCEGPNSAANEARARAAANALGQTPGETIAPGIMLGTIRVRPLTTSGQPDGAPGPGGGAVVLSDSSSGKADAVNAVVATLTKRGVPGYAVRPSASQQKWSIQFYNCAAPRPPFRDVTTRVQLPVAIKP
ncbi:MAG: hypothetical protein WBL74_01730 [Novosphingobium sp.]|uniref:hypothetical protein n=1 Tax=Novosphingobium sp. TaxID=1874826 RepID=UPI003C7A8906